MIAFAIVEIMPAFERMQFHQKYLPVGGLLSGFFGGLSGHQGALRSAFLIRTGLSKESFIATGVVIACLVDITRITIYAEYFLSAGIEHDTALLAATTLSAFTGAFLGSKLVAKVTYAGIQRVVSVCLIAVGIALAVGLI
jgi:uncharacterized membrane protein YfcA